MSTSIKRLSHGLSAEPVPVSAYVGSSKNLKDLKDSGRKCGAMQRSYLHEYRPLK